MPIQAMEGEEPTDMVLPEVRDVVDIEKERGANGTSDSDAGLPNFKNPKFKLEEISK